MEKIQSQYFKPWILILAMMGLLGGAFLVASLIRDTTTASMVVKSFSSSSSATFNDLQPQAIRHYATSRSVPQQSFKEITITYDVLKSLGRPANFLVFGLGHDSIMWASLNPRGTTLFLEDNPDWAKKILKIAPFLRAHMIKYRTHLSEASQLMNMLTNNNESTCLEKAILRGNEKCKLALDKLPEEAYDKEWDLIMIDAPMGYKPRHPGRMSVIFSAAVMARNRKGSGVTHVFLHDVNRAVEMNFGRMILCSKYLVEDVGRLWHFEIPPNTNPINNGFC